MCSHCEGANAPHTRREKTMLPRAKRKCASKRIISELTICKNIKYSNEKKIVIPTRNIAKESGEKISELVEHKKQMLSAMEQKVKGSEELIHALIHEVQKTNKKLEDEKLKVKHMKELNEIVSASLKKNSTFENESKALTSSNAELKSEVLKVDRYSSDTHKELERELAVPKKEVENISKQLSGFKTEVVSLKERNADGPIRTDNIKEHNIEVNDANTVSSERKKGVSESGGNHVIGEDEKVMNKSPSDEVNCPHSQTHRKYSRKPATTSTLLDNLGNQSVGQLPDQTADKSNKPVRNKKSTASLKSLTRPSFSLSSIVTIDNKNRKRGRGDTNIPSKKKKKRPTTAFDVSHWLKQ